VNPEVRRLLRRGPTPGSRSALASRAARLIRRRSEASLAALAPLRMSATPHCVAFNERPSASTHRIARGVRPSHVTVRTKLGALSPRDHSGQCTTVGAWRPDSAEVHLRSKGAQRCIAKEPKKKS